MARNRDPFTQALSSLRERIYSGILAGGSPVIVQEEAERLRLSTTPVREALARLSGEGLVERAPAGGYVTVRLDAAAARDRYAMQAHYVRIALELNRRALGAHRPPAPDFDAGRPAAAVDQLFAVIVRSAGNQVLWEAYQKVRGQLDLLRRVEPHLFDDLSHEASSLYMIWSKEAEPGFEAAAAHYHERRIRASGALAVLAAAGPAPDHSVCGDQTGSWTASNSSAGARAQRRS